MNREMILKFAIGTIITWMITVALTIVVLGLLGFIKVHAAPLPQPMPPSGSCSHGYSASGSFCVPRQGAQEAVPLSPNGSCPRGWTRSGNFCLRSGSN